MSNETSKSKFRRDHNGDFAVYFRGDGIDICCGPDPVTPDCDRWDIEDGDAEKMEGLEPETYDWVYSSHGLEHLSDPTYALRKWWDLIKPGGYLILVVPDFALYEHKTWPSKFASGHKWCFSILPRSQADHISVIGVASCLPGAQVVRLQINDGGFFYSDQTSDQTRQGAQAEIEMIFRKLNDDRWV